MAPSTVTDDYYQILEVSQGASTEDITRSYRRLALTTHPDRSNKADATAAFQLLSRAYETLKDEIERRHYDLHIYPVLKKPQPSSTQKSAQNSGAANEDAQIAQLQKSKQALQQTKQERTAAWNKRKWSIDTAIFELQREIRRIEQEIMNLDSIAAAEKAEDEKTNSWGTWLLSPFVKKVNETEEQITAKDRARQERRVEKDMKERKLVPIKAKLKSQEDQLEQGRRNLNLGNAKDDANISDIARKINDLENARMWRTWRQQKEEQEKREREHEARRRREQEESRRQQEVRQREAQEQFDAMLRKMQQQAQEQAIRAEQQAKKDREKAGKQRRRAESNFGRHHSHAQSETSDQARQRNESACLHDGWWPKVKVPAACPRCDDHWTYHLRCPNCGLKACPKCQADL